VDTLVHGVIGAALCSRTGLPGGRRGPVDEKGRRLFTDWTFWAAIFFGILPDIASLGIHFAVDFFAGNGVSWHGIPDFIFVLYNITHSLAGMAVCIGLLVWWKRSLLLPALAWPVHVLMDVFTHGDGRFMTPIFWPFTDWGFSGWNWWQYRGIFHGSWIFAAVVWLAVGLLRVSWRGGQPRSAR
jgi:hypothetical protein